MDDDCDEVTLRGTFCDTSSDNELLEHGGRSDQTNSNQRYSKSRAVLDAGSAGSGAEAEVAIRW